MACEGDYMLLTDGLFYKQLVPGNLQEEKSATFKFSHNFLQPLTSQWRSSHETSVDNSSQIHAWYENTFDHLKNQRISSHWTAVSYSTWINVLRCSLRTAVSCLDQNSLLLSKWPVHRAHIKQPTTTLREDSHLIFLNQFQSLTVTKHTPKSRMLLRPIIYSHRHVQSQSMKKLTHFK